MLEISSFLYFCLFGISSIFLLLGLYLDGYDLTINKISTVLIISTIPGVQIISSFIGVFVVIGSTYNRYGDVVIIKGKSKGE